MSFTTKMYTRPVLVAELVRLNFRKYESYSTFIKAFSPRAGNKSAKVAALKNLIGHSQLRLVFNQYSVLDRKHLLLDLVKGS